jgi:hypothetical protein
MSELNFVDACLQGEALIEDIDEYIERWHEGDSEKELHEFLGFTKDEYELWLHNDNSIIKSILFARKNGVSITDIDSISIAARSSSMEEAEKIIEWLRLTGRM